MKTKLLYLYLFVLSITYGQIPTNDLVREYLFTNGSLVNGLTPGSNDLITTGTSQVLISDAVSQANNALDINTNTYTSGHRDGHENITVSFWIKTATTNTTVRPIIEQYGQSGFGPYGWNIQLINGKVRIRSKFTNGGTDFKEVILESTVIADNNWHHVTFTAQNVKRPGYIAYGYFNRLYIDGIQQDTGVDYTNGANSTLNSTTTYAPYAHNVTLSSSTDGYTDGIDNIRIYNIHLSALDVYELYKDQFNNLNRLYVNKNATGTGFGDSWVNAITDVSEALSVANGQEIWVAQGIYTPDVSDRTKTFNISENVKLYGGFVGNETSLSSRDFITNITTLSGDLLDDDTATLSMTEPSRLDNSHRVVSITGNNTLIDGFTITSGHYNTTTTTRGAGVFKDNIVTSLELKNNTIINNVAQFDGAISALFQDNVANTLEIENCTIKNNLSKARTAFNIGLNYTANNSIAGVLDANVANCLIESNFASDINGYKGVSAVAGAFTAFNFANKRINASVISCTIINNTDDGTDPIKDNPALLYVQGNVGFNLHNNIVWNNSMPRTANASGIAKTFTRNLENFTNCIYSTALKNNITADDLSTGCGNALLTNNSNADPLFVNNTNNYSLQIGSPAIDTGINTLVNTNKDILQNDRIYNGTVDIGAYESSFGPNNFSLALNTVGPGTLNQTSGTYTPNTTISITATPNYGSVFVGWTGDVTSTNATISVLLDGNKSYTAKFESPIFVDASATGNNDGSNWTDAYTDLKDAIQNASADDQIWIAGGTYKPSTSSRSSYYVIDKENLKIYGGFAGTEVQLSDRILGTNETVLSGDIQGNDANVTDYLTNYLNTTRNLDNTYRIFNILATGNNLSLDGLTISDAHNNAGATTRGAAIHKDKTISDLTLRNCILKNNLARNDNAALLAEFELNNTSGSRGNLIVENCQFINNMSRWATGIYVFVRPSTNVDVTVTNTLFDGNLSGDLNNSTARGISGSAGWFRVIGDNSDMNLKLYNNTYVNNIDIGTNQMTTTNRAVVAISKVNGNNRSLNATVANNIFWSNTTTTGLTTRSITDLNKDPVTVNVYNSIDESNFNDSSITSTTAISNANPLFTNTSNNDYTLMLASPAIDTGDNTYVIGTTDLNGDSRIFNSIVDMGVYENDVLPTCTVNIPDTNFKSYLVGNTNINTNGDAEIQCSEATAFTGIIACTNLAISDLTGIEAFTEITLLFCQGNNLTSLDISANTELTLLTCTNNQLTSLDVTSNTLLTQLNCGDNNLTSLDVSTNTNLYRLDFNNNNVTNIDLSTNVTLGALICNDNGLTSLNLVANTNLDEIYCYNNNLTTLDVSANTLLTSLDCNSNSIQSLDVSVNTNLGVLICNDNQLSNLNIANSNNSSVNFMYAQNNIALSCIQIDVGFTPPNGSSWQKDATASFNSNCTALSLNDYELQDISIYPNPVQNILNIQLEESIEKVEFYSFLGRIVLESNRSEINISSLSSGIYLLKVYTENGKVGVKRFVKQ